MKKTIAAILMIALALGLLSSCFGGAAGLPYQMTFTAYNIPDGAEAPVLSVTMSWPEFTKDAGKGWETINGAMEAWVTEKKAECETLAGQTLDNGTECTAALGWTVMYLGESFISVLLEKDVYLGGAHGELLYEARTFDAKDGSDVSVVRMLGDENESQSLQRIYDAYRELVASDTEGAFFEDAAAILDEMQENGTFPTVYLTDDGAVCVMAPYLIAPYAYGSPLVRIAVG